MKIVTVGSGIIVEQFIEATRLVDIIQVIGSYSRTKERADCFSRKMKLGKSYFNFEDIVCDKDVNTVYIATPNALHFQQAKYFLENNMNVIIEKPICSTAEHAEELLEIAKRERLFIFEAISNIHTPNFTIIKDALEEIGDIKIVHANYSQYSNRYTEFKNGELPNVFNPTFSGGALMDLNVYNIHLITNLFGLPSDSHYYPNLEKGIDTSGVLIMDYDTFKVIATGAKDSVGPSYFHIQGDNGFISSSGIPNVLKNIKIRIDEEEYDIDYNHDHRLFHEVTFFEKVFLRNELDLSYQIFEDCINTLRQIEKSWKQADLNFKDIY